MSLRPYQHAASQSVDAALAGSDNNPCLVLPTGSGKTHVIADLARRYIESWPSTRILVLAHVKELVLQNCTKLIESWPMAPVGIYSAGIGLRQIAQITFASIQSVHKRAHELGAIDLVFVDEAHRIPVKGEGMYRSLIAELKERTPHLRVVGFTATPYRLGAGIVCGPDKILNRVCYDAKITDLIADGYLSPLTSKAGNARADLSAVHVRGGEYIKSELSEASTKDDLVNRAVIEALTLSAGRKARIWFAVDVEHAQAVSDALRHVGVVAPVVHAGTPKSDRDAFINDFKAGAYSDLININVLSEGFDAPHIDCVVMLRATKSAALYYQQVGRGLRLYPGKENCLVLDFAGNIEEHGPIDTIRVRDKRARGESLTEGAPTKACPECQEAVLIAVMVCPDCGYVWPESENPKHTDRASTRAVITEPPETVQVTGVSYSEHIGRSGTPTLRVDYMAGLSRYSEWVCLEHSGYARAKAEAWWRWRAKRGSAAPDVPETVDKALEYIGVYRLREPLELQVDLNGKHPEIVRYQWGADTNREAPDVGEPEDAYRAHQAIA